MLIGNNLLLEFNRLCKDAKDRFWVISPFLGNWNGIKEIVGENIFDKNLKIKLITDINNTSGIDKITLNKFIDNGNVRTLEGLHAKIYVVDDKVLITSANLSETAFCKRYEIGNIIDFNEEINNIFLNWWEISTKVERQDIKEKEYKYNSNIETGNSHSLNTKWDLPKKTEVFVKPKQKFFNYQDFLDYYENLTTIYYSNQMLWKSSQKYRYFEIDCFLDYLLHHDDKPSKPYYDDINKINKVDESKREKLIKEYATKFKQKILEVKANTANKHYKNFIDEKRINEAIIIKKLLNEKAINNLNKSSIKEILKCLDAAKAGGFIENFIMRNEEESIIKSWAELLHNTNEHIETRMCNCIDKRKFKLEYFDYSSIQELIGYYYPDKYPKRNRLVNAGLRFFGYEIKEIPTAI